MSPPPEGTWPRRGMFVPTIVAISIGFACAALAPALRADERTLWQLWSYHEEHLDDHGDVAEACRKVVEAAPRDPTTIVVNGIRAWHLLKSGRTADAAAPLESMLTPTPVGGTARARPTPLAEAGTMMARGWLTRLDREIVRRALKAYYARRVEFPDSLDAVWTLLPDAAAPRTDRWGKPWTYRPRGLRTMPELANQSYELQSVYLKERSDLDDALERTYAAAIDVTPVRLISKTPGRETMVFARGADADDGGQSVTLTVGATSEGIFFAHLGSALLILSDGDHWKVMPRPDVKR